MPKKSQKSVSPLDSTSSQQVILFLSVLLSIVSIYVVLKQQTQINHFLLMERIAILSGRSICLPGVNRDVTTSVQQKESIPMRK